MQATPNRRRTIVRSIALVVGLTAGLVWYFWPLLSGSDPALKRDYQAMPLPAGLRLTSQQYNRPDIDTPGGYEFTYAVSGTRSAVYDELLAALKADGYKLTEVGAETGPTSNYVPNTDSDLEAINSSRHVDVHFGIGPAWSDQKVTAADRQRVLDQPVNEVSADVSRISIW